MAESSWPFDNADTSESQYTELFRKFQRTGVFGIPSGTDLKVTATTGLGTSIAAGVAVVRGHFYKNSSALALTHDAGDSNPRIDLVVLRLDPTANSIVAAIVKGTPAPSPAPPSVTQTETATYEEILSQVPIAASASTITPAALVDKRRFMGKLPGIWVTAGRPTSPTLGEQGYNADLGYSEEWNGTTWRAVGTPATIDADTLNGISISHGTSLPGSGSDGDVFFLHS